MIHHLTILPIFPAIGNSELQKMMVGETLPLTQ